MQREATALTGVGSPGRGIAVLEKEVEAGIDPAQTQRAPAAGLVRRVHIIGIAGTGLRGMAGLLRERGYEVTGSEVAPGAALDDLRRRGVVCYVGHRDSNVRRDTDLVLVSAAIGKDNPELVAAKRHGIRVVKYAEYLGEVMRDSEGIAIAGTHGKTTTTAMLTQALQTLDQEPSFIVGGDYPRIGGCSGWGRGRVFVAEACEFDRSFHHLSPTHAVITNIEADHLDYFDSLAEIQEAFGEFAARLPARGMLAINADDANSAGVAARSPAPVRRFSLRPEGGDWWASEVEPRGGGICFVARSAAHPAVPVALRVPGIHNVKNALAVITLLSGLGHCPRAVAEALGNFQGVRRRFESLLTGPIVVIDDYAHHPTEIEMVVRAARETFPGRRLRIIFQPHQHSRTIRFLDGFAQVLSRADEIVLTDVFAARDSLEDMRRVNGDKLAECCRGYGGNARFLSAFDAIVADMTASARPGDVIACLGAGSVTDLAARLARALDPRERDRGAEVA